MISINRDNAVIHIRDLHKSFGALTVLNGVDLDLYEGENVAGAGSFRYG